MLPCYILCEFNHFVWQMLGQLHLIYVVRHVLPSSLQLDASCLVVPRFRGMYFVVFHSLSHRAPGSIGQNQSPGRVFKGKKMAGQMGNKQITVQTLDIVRVDAERGLLLIRGAVPGATGGDVIIKPAVKAKA